MKVQKDSNPVSIISPQPTTAQPALCTLPVSYWSANPSKLPNSVTIGNTRINRTMLQRYLADTSNSLPANLLKEIIAAKINRSQGKVTPEVNQVLTQVDTFVKKSGLTKIPDNLTMQNALKILQAFNNQGSTNPSCPR
jgi:hypothetical protein